jgi:NAD(P)-dependent dehydrogenase (short-subunit alcohol dehydrogenase family)
MQSIVVTGVSTGIGWAVTKFLIERGCRVFGSVRREQDAERLRRELGEAFVPLLFDVTREEEVHAAAGQVRQQLNGETLSGLINNAGIAVGGPLMHLPTEEFRHQLEVNLVGVLIVTKAFLPLLGADRARRGKPGRILNISSVSGKIGYPFMGAYAASKHGLEGFSESLRRELMLYGIDVIIIGPGSVATPIWDKAGQADVSKYANTDYVDAVRRAQASSVNSGRQGLPTEKVCEVAWEALTSPNPRVRYAVHRRGSLSPLFQIPFLKRLVDKVIAKNLGFQ